MYTFNFKNKKNMKKSFVIIVALAAASLTTQAQITLQPFFSDNMVLQQKTNAPFWGEVAQPNSRVDVTTSWNKKTYTTTADNKGHWRVDLATPKAGGPYTVRIVSGQHSRELQNVLIGEVWLCTGQSNMEMPLAGWGRIDNYEEEIAQADNYPNIRIINMKKVIGTEPAEDIVSDTDGWQVCSSKTIPEFSAAGYFFGRQLLKTLKVPVGLLATNWGGTLAEAWTSEESLRDMPYFGPAIDKVKNSPADQAARERRIKEETRVWWEQVNSADNGFAGGQPLWAGPDCDDHAWPTMSIPGKIEENGLPAFDGVVWLRKHITIPESWQGKALILRLGNIDDNDITYFNGTMIGQTEGWLANRDYEIPAALVKAGEAVITVRFVDTGGDGGLVATANQPVSIAPVSDAASAISLAGPWRYKATTNMKNLPPMPVNNYNSPNQPTVLYNAMLNPIKGYALKGAIWYQGESNADRAFQYRELLPLMINDWRMQWNKVTPTQLDFYIVQLANFMKKQTAPEESAWAELREAQMWTAQHLAHTGIATAIDIGMDNDIHPKNKQEVGRRLALAALAQTYGKNVAYSGPVYTGYRIEGNAVRLFFDHAEGMTIPDQANALFTIAAADRVFHWAKSRVEGNTIVVWADGISFPVAVRYNWANNPTANIYNADGLPMFPFRTDQWPTLTNQQ